jgi:YggT family protein
VNALFELFCIALTIYGYILFARIILSWLEMAWRPPMSLIGLIRFIYQVTDPVLFYFRRLIPPIGGLDISPIFVFIIIAVIKNAIGCGGIGLF